MELIQDKNSRSGAIGTVLFHLILLLLFIQFGLPYKVPPEENIGAMMVNFSPEGGGGASSEEKVQETEEASSNSETSRERPSENTSANNQEDLLSQQHTETVDLDASQESDRAEEKEETVSESLSEALQALNNSQNQSSSNSGTNNNGNQQNGNSSGTGTSNGTVSGIGFDLGGRGKVSFKKPDNPTQEDGKVVVDIVVDKYGKVIKATPGARGSTTTNPILYKQAKEAALKARFTKKLDTPTDQKGTMTFVFILN